MDTPDARSQSIGEASPPMSNEPAQVDVWVRHHLGRQILIGCATDLPESARALLARNRELRTAPLPPTSASEIELESALVALLPTEPHALLFWLDDGGGQKERAARIYRACDRAGALDQCYVALLGPSMSRVIARSLTFEDGFAWPADAPRLLGSLLAQAETREEARRRGSSPPCYL